MMDTPHDDSFSMEQVKQKIDEVANSITEYSDEQKERFEAAFDHVMEPIDEQIEKLQSRSESLSDETEQKLDRLVLKLQTERDMFEARLKATRAATGQSWLQLKDGIQSAWSELAKTAENIVSTYRKTISKQT